jgi:hypothetical protein
MQTLFLGLEEGQSLAKMLTNNGNPIPDLIMGFHK